MQEHNIALTLSPLLIMIFFFIGSDYVSVNKEDHLQRLLGFVFSNGLFRFPLNIANVTQVIK